ncbi:MAG TPA: ATPase, T2SS/T4P/T4SS family [Stellaceae bacterium]|nr:ATPase, T2SS/T4P/T4SS family [Stellaceae bacterium]
MTLQELVRNALRMWPNHIIVGEMRGAEAFEMISGFPANPAALPVAAPTLRLGERVPGGGRTAAKA